jgi:hypothetical protein
MKLAELSPEHAALATLKPSAAPTASGTPTNVDALE